MPCVGGWAGVQRLACHVQHMPMGGHALQFDGAMGRLHAVAVLPCPGRRMPCPRHAHAACPVLLPAAQLAALRRCRPPCTQAHALQSVSPRLRSVACIDMAALRTSRCSYTPLLPAMCAGTVEERSIVEPVRAVLGGKVRTGSLMVSCMLVGLGTAACCALVVPAVLLPCPLC